MLCIRWVQKRALVVVKPPGDFRRVRILEIDDDVFVAIEKTCSPGLRSAMRHSGEMELCSRIIFFFVEAVKESRGRCTVKAAVMKAQPYTGHVGGYVPFSFSCRALE